MQEPAIRAADNWDACWALGPAAAPAVSARTTVTLGAAPESAPAWACAAGLWGATPRGALGAAPEPPAATLEVNATHLHLPPHLLVRGEAAPLDLAPLLHEGLNELALTAAYEDFPTYFGVPVPPRVGVFLQCDIRLPDGRLVRLATGDHDTQYRVMIARPPLASTVWTIAPQGTFLHPHQAAPLLRFPRRGGRVEAEADACRVGLRHERRSPAPAGRLTLVPGAHILLDFGEELVGRLAATAAGPAAFTLTTGESQAEAAALAPGMDVPLREVHLPESGEWRDRRRAALRWVAVRNDADRSVDVEVTLDAQEIDVVSRGEFRCSDPVLERVYEVGRGTVIRATHDFVEDGPKRDRLLWLGDLASAAATFGATVGDLRPLRRSLLLAAGTQMRNGALPGVGPHPNHLVLADYVPLWAVALDTYVLYSGDTQACGLLLPTLRGALGYMLERIGSDGLVGPEEETDWWVFLDWDRRTPFESNVARHAGVAALSLVTAAGLDAGARVALLADAGGEAAAWSAAAGELRDTVMTRCWDDSTGGLADWARGGERSRHRSRLTAAWAVLSGAAQGQRREALLDDLAGDVLPPTTTGYGQRTNVEALFRGGRPEAALDLVRNYWGGMLDLGATTFWESYDPGEDPATATSFYARPFANSLCHAWSGSVAETLATFVLGVEPLAPGFARIRHRPARGGLAWAEGVVPTPHGPITVTRDGIDVPPGVEVTDG